MSRAFQVYGGSPQEILSSLRALERKHKEIRARLRTLPATASTAEIIDAVNDLVAALAYVTTDRWSGKGG